MRKGLVVVLLNGYQRSGIPRGTVDFSAKNLKQTRSVGQSALRIAWPSMVVSLFEILANSLCEFDTQPITCAYMRLTESDAAKSCVIE